MRTDKVHARLSAESGPPGEPVQLDPGPPGHQVQGWFRVQSVIYMINIEVFDRNKSPVSALGLHNSTII